MKVDTIVKTIIARFKTRAVFGKKKYGTDLDRTDLNLSDWLQHLQDELHDAYLYSEKLKQDIQKKDRLLELFFKFQEEQKEILESMALDGYFVDDEKAAFKEFKKLYTEVYVIEK